MDIDKRPDGLPWNVDTARAAEIIGVSKGTVRNLEKEGKLHRLPIPGLRFSTDEVLKIAGKQKDTSSDLDRMEKKIASLQSEVEALRDVLRGMCTFSQDAMKSLERKEA
jgi:hypothetical protein|nr:MAG TPA: chaperone-modulator protein [Caudoviricetes sp.]